MLLSDLKIALLELELELMSIREDILNLQKLSLTQERMAVTEHRADGTIVVYRPYDIAALLKEQEYVVAAIKKLRSKLEN